MNNDYIDLKINKKEQIFIKRLLEIAQSCNENGTDSCIYEVGNSIGKIEVKMEFSYELKD